nr:unnamed protein product [Digitaria exilis]
MRAQSGGMGATMPTGNRSDRRACPSARSRGRGQKSPSSLLPPSGAQSCTQKLYDLTGRSSAAGCELEGKKGKNQKRAGEKRRRSETRKRERGTGQHGRTLMGAPVLHPHRHVKEGGKAGDYPAGLPDRDHLARTSLRRRERKLLRCLLGSGGSRARWERDAGVLLGEERGGGEVGGARAAAASLASS